MHGAGASENGMAAFDAAIAAGFGIECDVRASRDGVAFVHHDRAFGDTDMDSCDAKDVARHRLADGGEIPRLATVLARCPADWPLLVEIKAEGWRVAPVCRAVMRDLAGRAPGATAIMSFNPLICNWFFRFMPQFPRGLILTRRGKAKVQADGESALALWWGKPDFLACDIDDLPSPLSVRARAQDMPVLSWTVRSAAERARAALHADQIIFEAEHD
ncbi:MAG: glycerophosphodiester phosphodiesterase family protein [Pseudomonadota bacterium]